MFSYDLLTNIDHIFLQQGFQCKSELKVYFLKILRKLEREKQKKKNRAPDYSQLIPPKRSPFTLSIIYELCEVLSIKVSHLSLPARKSVSFILPLGLLSYFMFLPFVVRTLNAAHLPNSRGSIS